MHVVWKRPDGFLGASPEDFLSIQLGDNYSLWLHKADKDGYPFRISGGWEEEASSRKLNNFVNLLGLSEEAWLAFLNRLYTHTLQDDPGAFIDEQLEWLQNLASFLKGDGWEVEIIDRTLVEVRHKLQGVRDLFIGTV